MSRVIDLVPPATYTTTWAGIEAVCDYIDDHAGEEFSKRDLHRATLCLGAAADTVIRSYLALGFIYRVRGGPGPRPVYYRVTPKAMPKAALS